MTPKRFIRGMFDRSGGLEKRVFWFVTFCILCVELLSIVLDALNGMDIRVTVVNLVGILLTMTTSFFAVRTKKYSSCYTVLCMILNLLLMPATFLFAGGFDSGVPIYLTLAVIVCATHPKQEARYTTALIVLLWYSLMFLVVGKNPDLVTPITEDASMTDLIVSVFVAALFSIGLLSFIVEEMRSSYNTDVREYETRTKMRLELLQSQTENIEEAKYQRKEMRRHNMIITEYAEKGDFEGLLNYLQEKKYVDEKYTKKAIYCMNAIINSVLEIYVRQAVRKNIPMDIRADVTPEIGIPDPDLVTLVSNILENAVAGAENSDNPEKKVFIDIHTRDQKLVILCRNSCSSRLHLNNGYPGHPGIGISIVEKIVHANGGLLDYSIENGMVLCKLVVHTTGKKRNE